MTFRSSDISGSLDFPDWTNPMEWFEVVDCAETRGEELTCL